MIIEADGSNAARAALEGKHALRLERALGDMLRAVAPRGLTPERADVEQAVAALREASAGLRDGMVDLLVEAGNLGARVGLEQAARVLGMGKALPGPGERKPAEINLTNWDLVNQAVLAWVLGSGDGFGHGYVDVVTRAMVMNREAHVRMAMAEWIRNGLPLRALIDALRPMFDGDRAEMVAVTEVTRAFARGNIIAWRESGVVTGMEWATANDERVCPICAPLGGLIVDEEGVEPVSIERQLENGVRVGLDQPFVHPGGPGAAGNYAGQSYGHPPAHPRCRCWLRPVV